MTVAVRIAPFLVAILVAIEMFRASGAMEALIGAKVFLKLWVKVSKGWRNDPKRLWNLGYK